MKKVYTKPEMDIKTFANEDIITVSGGLVTSINGGAKYGSGDNIINF